MRGCVGLPTPPYSLPNSCVDAHSFGLCGEGDGAFGGVSLLMRCGSTLCVRTFLPWHGVMTWTATL